ncbi:MAG: peptide-methionine (S)-S-oxide reductase MsrA [Methylovulum sp.]|uniref:peptide-methionine (S)-S-oxide reductase MsrA n=1 Tax=Methylovulum sp. TaxID=1916980 RepID=UPI00260A43D7|nr:peptide-methionine (S)-S-oxide reductase MsrA [Methylovulum sp.]MDD2725225.1 peptide-methionine (S)-S-oxide reductase MsrA [Methylovulum sp.]MDD5124795.1 peptide-methionine (S)-S-oxide reductase MsrA [Methylovulum sp.]
MNRWHRAFWSLFTLGILVIAAAVLPNAALLAGKNANSSLNKAAAGPGTPYIVLGMGCFWGAEKRMQALAGVVDVEAGYAGGDIANPRYETLHDTEAAIHKGQAIKNHAEAVKVYFDPQQTTLERVLIQFWQSHNPTQGNRQGNDKGSNYRSAVFYRTDEERQLAEKTRAIYQTNLTAAGIAEPITTEIAPLKNYTAAEDYHQDYLEKNPLGYCGLGGTGVAYTDPASGINPHTPLTGKNAATGSNWQNSQMSTTEQLIAFESVDCGYCRLFDKEVLSVWKNPIPIVATHASTPPNGWTLTQPLFATPTIVLFRNKQEVARYTGYQGVAAFWQWLGGAASGNQLGG